MKQIALLLMLLLPLFMHAQSIDYSYPTNVFGGTDTVQTFKFYKSEIDPNIIDFPIVRSLFYSYNTNLNTKTGEVIASQTGTSDPTFLVVKSDFGTLEFTYSSVGTYVLKNKIGAFTLNKTFLFIQNMSGNNNFNVNYMWTDADTLTIYTKNGTTLSNGVLNKCFLKLLVYK